MYINNHQIGQYFTTLIHTTAVTSDLGQVPEPEWAINEVMVHAVKAHARGNNVIFVGNGGSASIACHMATDFAKYGGVGCLALNDSSMLTCLGNDLGCEQVFAKQIELHARPQDVVIVISSSGRSPNIVNAVKAARAAECIVITLSGFNADNSLRKLGDINFFLSSDQWVVTLC